MADRFLDRKSAAGLVADLVSAYPHAKYYLNFSTPVELMVAAIMSAQTHDEVVNASTPSLFAKYKTAKDFASADPQTLTSMISKVSFAGNKAKNIKEACRIVAERYGGKVPDSMDALVELPGIGRKTANTILINAYGKVEGVPVDTWVIKLSYRLGLSKNKDPEKIEQDLMGELDRRYWGKVPYVLKTHGKTLCKAVPICSKCPVSGICPKNGVTKTL